VGALLFFAPFIFGSAAGGIKQRMPMLPGALTMIMSLLTDYQLGMLRWIPFRIHLGVDLLGGLLLVASPWLLGSLDIVWWQHMLAGIMEIALVALTERPMVPA
jgi:hypothetical protein